MKITHNGTPGFSSASTTSLDISVLVLLLVLQFTTPVCARASSGDPLAGLELLKDFQAKRVSSSDPDWRNGNADFRPVEPGQTLTLAELKGPGMIAHLWCTMAHRDAYGLVSDDAAHLLGRRETPQRRVSPR